MSSFEDLPHVVWKVIYSYMDRESVLRASNVCVSWRKMIHDLSSPSNCDSELKVKLEKCGWIMSEHDVEKCSCINLNMGLYKFIKNVPLSFEKVCEATVLQNDLRFCVSESRLCYAMNDAKSISILHLTTQEESETINMDLYMEEDGVLSHYNALQSIDNTLVILENSNDLRSKKKKVHLWNLIKAEYVAEINVSEIVKIGYNFEIEHVKLTKNKLLVKLHIYNDDGDSLGQFLIWNLDTEDPSTSNLTHWRTVDQNRGFRDYAVKVYMNSKLFCYIDKEHHQLRIFYFDDLPNFKTKALNEKEDGWAWDFLDVKLESGDSGRLAIYDGMLKKLRVYNLDNDNVDVEIQVDFSSIRYMTSTILMSGFFMDNLIFVNLDQKERGWWYRGNELNFIIVTKMGDVVECNKHMIMHTVNKDAFFYVDNFGLMMETVNLAVVNSQEFPIQFVKQIHLYHM